MHTVMRFNTKWREDMVEKIGRRRNVWMDGDVAPRPNKGKGNYGAPKLPAAIARGPDRAVLLSTCTTGTTLPTVPAFTVPTVPATAGTNDGADRAPATGIDVATAPATAGTNVPTAPATGIGVETAPTTGINMDTAPCTYFMPTALGTGINMEAARGNYFFMPTTPATYYNTVTATGNNHFSMATATGLFHADRARHQRPDAIRAWRLATSTWQARTATTSMYSEHYLANCIGVMYSIRMGGCQL
eukprot:jgi/Mesvir1/26474/Mv16144-RA.1